MPDPKLHIPINIRSASMRMGHVTTPMYSIRIGDVSITMAEAAVIAVSDKTTQEKFVWSMYKDHPGYEGYEPVDYQRLIFYLGAAMGRFGNMVTDILWSDVGEE